MTMEKTETQIIPRRGYLYVAVAAVLWAVSGTASKYLFMGGYSPKDVVQLRLTISSGVMLLGLLAARPKLLRLSIRDLPYFLLLGTFGTAAVQYAYFFAISRIDVAAAILLQDLAPVFIVCHSWLFAKERVSAITLGCIAVATFGCYFVVGGYNLSAGSMNFTGVMAGLLSAVTFAIYSVAGEYGMRRYHPVTILFYAMIFGALVWNIVHPPLSALLVPASGKEWALVLFIAVPGTIFPYGLFLRGVSLIRSARACLTSTLEPITAGFISFLLLGEVMKPLQLFGAALVVAAIAVLQLKQEPDDKAPALIRARKRAKSAS